MNKLRENYAAGSKAARLGKNLVKGNETTREREETPIGAREIILRKIRLQREITVNKDER